MPDSGLPREPCARRATRGREGLGDAGQGSPRALTRGEICAICETAKEGVLRGVPFCVWGYSSLLMTRSMSSWRECTSSFA